MKTVNIVTSIAVATAIGLTGCSSDNEIGTLNLDIKGLSDLGNKFKYEGWLIVAGKPKSTGTFSVNKNGKLSRSSFRINVDDLNNAGKFVLTIEPSPDKDPKPSKTHILAGDFSGDKATLSIEHKAAFDTHYSKAKGKYILATPTNGRGADELSGVWWPKGKLTLDPLPKGWKYEGWAVIDGKPVSTGTFTSTSKKDDSAAFSDDTGPAFPGEDFLKNAPEGLTFPTDLSAKKAKIVISVEPNPDNSPKPFLLKPLFAEVPSDATDHTPYDMKNISAKTTPTGTVSRK